MKERETEPVPPKWGYITTCKFALIYLEKSITSQHKPVYSRSYRKPGWMWISHESRCFPHWFTGRELSFRDGSQDNGECWGRCRMQLQIKKCPFARSCSAPQSINPDGVCCSPLSSVLSSGTGNNNTTLSPFPLPPSFHRCVIFPFHRNKWIALDVPEDILQHFQKAGACQLLSSISWKHEGAGWREDWRICTNRWHISFLCF